MAAGHRTPLLDDRTFSLGVSGVSFVSLLQMLQVKVPPVPEALGIAAVAFSFATAAGVTTAITTDHVRRSRLRRSRQAAPWWYEVFWRLSHVALLVGVVAVIVHLYPGHLAWVSFAVAAVIGIGVGVAATSNPDDYADDQGNGDCDGDVPLRECQDFCV
jgi:hypothetical protein